ncbi:helix-turn-helix domain-containing protein [Flavobacteriaceae bacterium Ap0902]|nr:helix-turn-helix domain-containing protein [Flavobacteriaceae bacterium Ap0902]
MKLNRYYQQIFEEELQKEILENATAYSFKAEDEIIGYNDTMSFIPLLQNGVIKVFKENKDGDEILLYFLETGETCAFTLQCIITTGKKSEIRAVAETDGDLLRIPMNKMEEWMSKYTTWRQFILSSYQSRVYEMLDVIDSIAFQKLDERLINYLKDKAMVNQTMYLNLTHQQIANELNSSRVVISRMLKKMETNGLIKTGRNYIELKDL